MCSENIEVLERRLGGEVWQEENGVLAKKSAVQERNDEGTVGLGAGRVARRMGLRRRPRFWIQAWDDSNSCKTVSKYPTK